MQRNDALEARASALYDAALPYHNFAHALDAVRAGQLLVDRCRDDGVPIEADVVYYALLFHDAGYHEDHNRYGYATKEEYAAALARDVLTDFGVSPQTIARVGAAILATHRDAVFQTNEEKAVRAADLAGLAAEYPVFRASSERLKQEWEFLHGFEISWRQWIDGTREVIGFFLAQDIRLTRYYLDAQGDSVFHKRAEANMRRLYEEKVGQPSVR
jgi:predicted metal-dependent HD superfamily phosphohydrolase